MVSLRRRNSEVSLKASVAAAKGAGLASADFITQAMRRRTTRGALVNSDQSNKRKREVAEEDENNANKDLPAGLETPVIKSSGLAVKTDNEAVSTSTMSTDASTGTSECLEDQQNPDDQRERVERKQLALPSSSQSVCCSESSEVCVSHDASGREVISCSACTTITIAEQADKDDVDDVDDVDDAEELDEFDPYAFIKTLPPLHKCVPARSSFLLPRQTRHSYKKTLVLDLDETLVHSTLDGAAGEHSDFVFPVSLGSITHMVAVRKRPHLHTFLESMARHFEIVVFTASQQIYAEQLLDIVDPNGEYIRHRIYRDSCVVWEGNYLKDLTVLGRDLAHTIIVDNSPQAFGFQLENGVPIKSWYDDEDDTELLRLLPFLEELAQVDDVRPYLGDRFGLKNLVESRPYPTY
jgi:CTD small phosphatase-like protein 2